MRGKFGGHDLDLGQDATFGKDRKAPKDYSVATDEATLRTKMRALLDVFADDDKHGMAKALFDKFLLKNKEITIFSSDALNKSIADHANFLSFAKLALAAPGTSGIDPSWPRIHQRLEDAGWDIHHVCPVDDLGVPAFNLGEKWRATEDFGNGLGVMIDSVQYVFIHAEKYVYDPSKKQYEIELQFVLYDVFGLDDDDLLEYGASSAGLFHTAAGEGITAWWQLQHQFGYAPVLTRAVVNKKFKVPTGG